MSTHALTSRQRWAAVAGLTAAALAASAWYVRRKTREAERMHPPTGRFVTVQGVRLHFTVHGRDDAPQTVVMLHGTGSMGVELEASGLVDMAAERFRVVVFDRPGHGHSDRPAGKLWTPNQQADLFHAALLRMGIERPIVLGHSWGTLIALAMAMWHPESVGALALASGYYFPSVRLDAPLLSLRAVPLLGTLLRHTLSPLVSRLAWPLALRRVFGPAPTSEAFRERFPVWLALRPSQLRANAQEAATLIPAALAMRKHYRELDVPTVLVAGASDRYLSTTWHSAHLHELLDRSWLRIVEGAGHMVHHAAPAQVMAAVEQAAALAWDRSLKFKRPAGVKADEASRLPSPFTAPIVVPCVTPRS